MDRFQFHLSCDGEANYVSFNDSQNFTIVFRKVAKRGKAFANKKTLNDSVSCLFAY